MAKRIEVSFNPHGAAEEWPHFLACAGEEGGVEFLYELLPDGWFCTMRVGGPGGFSLPKGGQVPIQNEELEEKLWEGVALLTEDPDAEAQTLREGSSTWESFVEPGGTAQRTEESGT